MSTEVTSPLSEKKGKKRMDGSESSSKKRKHEGAQDGSPAAAVAEETPAKKQKKDKKNKNGSNVADASARQDSPVEESEQRSLPTATTTFYSQDSLNNNSPFVQNTASLYLALAPVAHNFPLTGLCAEYISPLLLTYYPPLKGVVMAYSNPRLSEEPESEATVNENKPKVVLSRSIDEYAVTYVWLTAEFVIFRPRKGTIMEGHVNLQNESVLGVVCYNYFNAGIERNRLPKDWTWVASNAAKGKGNDKQKDEVDGYFVDRGGRKIDGRLVFQVKDFEATAQTEAGGSTINILGTLLSKDDDAIVDEEVRRHATGKKRSKP